MTETTAGRRLVPTGVQGLDDVLNGGLPKGHVYLLEGAPGTGKTTLGLQFLISGRDAGERLLYVTLSQSRQELLDIAASHGMNLDGIDVVELSATRLAENTARRQTVLQTADVELESLVRAVETLVEEYRPDRLVFDSLTEVQLLSNTSLRYRREFLGLKEMLADRGITTLTIGTTDDDAPQRATHALAHGVILLSWRLPKYGATYRRLAVTKIRGHAFVEGHHDFAIITGGIEVYPRLRPSSVECDRTPPVLTSGVAELDSLLADGMEGGTTCLIAGHAGTGKSTLATTYAHAAARQGRKSALFLFEERPAIFVDRARSLSMPLDDPAMAGLIDVRRVDPGEISLGRLFQQMAQAADDGADMIVIDSLTGLQATVPEEVELIPQIHALLNHLGRRKVLCLITVNMSGLLGEQPLKEVDMSLMADTILLLRQYEGGSAIRRTLSLIKRRYGAHDSYIRAFSISSAGISVERVPEGVHPRLQTQLGEQRP